MSVLRACEDKLSVLSSQYPVRGSANQSAPVLLSTASRPAPRFNHASRRYVPQSSVVILTRPAPPQLHELQAAREGRALPERRMFYRQKQEAWKGRLLSF
ncbi:hypothetical protein SRHO_G00295410 [Serrasalmus rhombeus]